MWLVQTIIFLQKNEKLSRTTDVMIKKIYRTESEFFADVDTDVIAIPHPECTLSGKNGNKFRLQGYIQQRQSHTVHITHPLIKERQAKLSSILWLGLNNLIP